MKKLLLMSSLLLAVSLPTRAADTPMPFNDGGKWGYIARHPENITFVLKPTYEIAHPFSEGLAAVRKDGLWGFIDTKGVLVIPCKYEELGTYDFRGGVAIVKKGELHGAIDKTGKEVLPIKFLQLFRNEKTKTLIGKIPDPANPNGFEGLSGMYDLAGKLLLPHEYSDIGPWLKDKTTTVTKNKLKALVNNKGQLLTPLKYSGTYYTGDDRIESFVTEIGEDEGYDLYDADGRLLFKSTHAYVGTLNDKRAQFKDSKTKKYGFLNEKGDIVIPAKFFLVKNFSEGVAFVEPKIAGPLEIIDVDGKVVGTLPNSDLTNGFENGFAWVRDKTDFKYYCYNRQFQKVFAQGFEYAFNFDKNKLSKVKTAKDKVGLLDTKGQWVVQPEYKTISLVEETGQYIAEKDSDVRLIDSKGATVFTTKSVAIEPYDEQYYFVKPIVSLFDSLTGKGLKGSYHCMLRKDGVVYYVAAKPQ